MGKKNQLIAEEILAIFEQHDLDLRDRVEIIANLTLQSGLLYTGVDKAVNRENVATLVFEDRQANGETIANSLALQGLSMLDWLNQKQN